jgi:hypothetical protein
MKWYAFLCFFFFIQLLPWRALAQYSDYSADIGIVLSHAQPLNKEYNQTLKAFAFSEEELRWRERLPFQVAAVWQPRSYLGVVLDWAVIDKRKFSDKYINGSLEFNRFAHAATLGLRFFPLGGWRNEREINRLITLDLAVGPMLTHESFNPGKHITKTSWYGKMGLRLEWSFAEWLCPYFYIGYDKGLPVKNRLGNHYHVGGTYSAFGITYRSRPGGST